MKKLELLAIALGTLAAMPAVAEESSRDPVTANATLTNNYVFRGISRTGTQPAAQAGFDYANPNGFYAGVWGSSISWLSDAGKATSAGVEYDLYLGMKNRFATDFTYDFGYVRYNFPGTYAANVTSADTNEIYGALGYQWLALKYSYSLGRTFGIAQAAGTSYVDLSANYPIADSGFTIGAHYGRQTYKGSGADSLKAAGMDPSYSDYKVNASVDVRGYILGVACTKANVKGGYYTNPQGVNLGRFSYVLSLNRTF